MLAPLFTIQSHDPLLFAGLHVESHGMVANYMYDPATNDTFRMGFGPNDTDPKWWDAGEPIWVTGKKHVI
jgi:predicted AlkP superfamily pyrophosphatase or phosphodiesterase